MSQRKLVTPELKDGPTECSPETFCAALKTMAAVKSGNGLTQEMLLSGGTIRLAVFYRRSAKEQALALIYCPWCGKRIDFYRQEAT